MPRTCATESDEPTIEAVEREIILSVLGPDAPESSTEAPTVDDGQLRAADWYGCVGLRLRLLEEGIVRTLRDAEAHGQCMRLERAGYVREVGKGAYALTAEGRHSLDWAGAPKPTFLNERQWAAELARAIATHHRVDVHVMLRTTKDIVALRARARLCFALYGRGWPVERIGRHFGLTEETVRKAIERWRFDRARRSTEGISR